MDETHELILRNLEEMKAIAAKERSLLFRELRKLDEDLDGLRERIIHLEHEARVTRWIFAGAGGIIAIIIKEVVEFFLR